MELQQELARVLQALDLGDVPEDAVTSLFNTGGTAVSADTATAQELAELAPLDKLRKVERVFAKYLCRLQAATQSADIQRFWPYVASEEALDAIVGDEASRAHGAAVYRTLFTLLHAVINVRDVYVKLSTHEKLCALQKALVAAKVYLSWLQLPGGSAYGLFMPYVYRQVLDVLKKWLTESVQISNSAAAQAGAAHVATPKPKAKAKARGRRSRQPHGDDSDNDEEQEDPRVLVQKLRKLGMDMLDMMVTFLRAFSLSSSKESVIPTIEMVVFLQATSCLSAADSSMDAVAHKSGQILDCLLNGSHGKASEIARVVVHCYVPGIAFQESTSAGDHRGALRFHKLAIETIARVRSTLEQHERSARQDDNSDDEEEEATGSTLKHSSMLRLGLLQNVCLHAPERAEERQRLLTYAFSIATEDTNKHTTFSVVDHLRFVRFLLSYSRNIKAKFRQFPVELVGRFVLDPTFWQLAADGQATQAGVPISLRAYMGVSPLLDVLIDRSRDKVSSVRAKAIAAISGALSLSLQHTNASAHEGDDEDAEEPSHVAVHVIANSLREILFNQETREDSALMRRLIELFRESLTDEKTFVRKAALQALEALLVVRPGARSTIRSDMRKDLLDIHTRCTDTSVLVRVQAIKSLSAILLKFPNDEEVQKLWNLGVLPLCDDPEASVQSCSLEYASSAIFERILSWHRFRKSQEQQRVWSSVWRLVSHLDGVMVRCAQKALRVLVRDSKIDVRKLIRACITAIEYSVNTDESDGDDEIPRLCYWGFSWVVLEELAHSNTLIEASQAEQRSLGIIVECWNRLQRQELPIAFNDGSKRILRVIAELSPVIDAQDAKEIADSILASLHSFAIPLNVITDAVAALHGICKAKAPNSAKGKAISAAWSKKLLELCEANLRTCFEKNPQLVVEDSVLIQKQLIVVGELALLEFNKDDDKGRDPTEIALLTVPTAVKSLVQLFLTPQISSDVAILASQSQRESTGGDDDNVDLSQTPVDIPTCVRVCAFVTLGKLCLRDQELAKDCITMLIRELRTCPVQDIRSNILLILGDLCIRYTALVDIYNPTIALSLLDDSALIRRNALLLFSQLILQDYIKWRESLFRFFLRAVVDEDEELASLARHVLCGPLLQKSPHLFTNKFIEMIFVFNNFEDKVQVSEPHEKEGIAEIALPGSARYPQRAQLYQFLLQNMSDEQKLQISMKLCTEILEEVSEGKLPLSANPANITDCGTEAVLKDTFAILCTPEIKLSSSKDKEVEDGELEDDVEASQANGNAGSVASQLAAAKGKLLSKMSKKNFLENVVPVLIALKHTLESKHSPLMRYLLHYLRELFKSYRDEVKEILSADPQLAMEVEYDLRQYELQRKQQEEQHPQLTRERSNVTPTKGGGSFTSPTPSGPSNRRSSVTPMGSATKGTPQQAPAEQTRGTPQLDADAVPRLRTKKHNARRRKSLPAPATPIQAPPTRSVASDEAKKTPRPESPLLFSPSKTITSSGGAAWRVTAKSPAVAARRGRGRGAITQQELEENMQRELVSAFDEASDKENDDDNDDDNEDDVEAPVVRSSRRHANKDSSKGKAKAKAAKVVPEEPEEKEDEDEIVQLPLKKKAKKKKTPREDDATPERKSNRGKAKNKAKGEAVDASPDPRRSQRKRKATN
ncbi:TPA: hypothetical protein N0F65_004171 [Lagenidium giganteum]|uniref:Condensin complex subunit 1 C-terminal domain-containing protein n=1 Tax=Lagenidium giganteum TaxID=4803 RepID=A0AAV2ZEQ1_9STRA|nr:TPA: hypothetical protein N0F65_004171 [Lagenidium giganteum]